MSKLKIFPSLLISMMNLYMARPVQAAQLILNPCPSFSGLNYAADRSFSTDGVNKDSTLSGDILRELYALKSLPLELAMLKGYDFCADQDQGSVTS